MARSRHDLRPQNEIESTLKSYFQDARFVGLLLKGRTMGWYRALYVGALISIMLMAGCGGGTNGSSPNNVTVAVSPMSVTIPANGEVTLQASIKGSPGTASATWFIAELAINGASGAQCNWSGTTQPAGPCPDGTIEGADASSSLTVKYHAPSTAGTFHVTAQWSTAFNPVVVKDGTAVITVGP